MPKAKDASRVRLLLHAYGRPLAAARRLAGADFPDVEMYEELARTAERGLLDMVFSGDGTGVPDTWRGSRDAAVEWGVNWPRQDMNPVDGRDGARDEA